MDKFDICVTAVQLLLAFLLVDGKPALNADRMVLVRVKRDAVKSLIYSGFNPQGGMTAFASSADFYPQFYHQSALQPASALQPPSALQPASGLSPASANEAPTVIYPGKDESGNNFQQNPPDGPPPESVNHDFDANSLQPPAKPKKKPAVQGDEEEESDASGKGSSSRSTFNAWFPIMLGTFPGNGGGGVAYKDAEGGGGRPYGTTIIANSVSHGRSGVAHAVAYGGSGLPNFRHSDKDAPASSA